MNIDRKVIQQLNGVLGQYLISINQYFLHARILNNWGFDGLGKIIYKKSIQAMKEADDIIERVLILEGLPNLQELGKLLIGEDVSEILKCDLNREYDHRRVLIESIEVCERSHDYVSREMLSTFLDECEEYIDWLETQFDQMKEMGGENYLQSMMAGG